MKSVRE